MKIIVPTDFSKNSITATHRAFELAIKNNWEILLLHYFTFSDKDIEKEYKELLKEGISKEMQDLSASLAHIYPGAVFQHHCIQGEFLKSLKKSIDDFQAGMLILGTKGASGWKHLTIGSNAYNAIDHVDIPVLAIPENCNKLDIRKVGILTNFKEIEKKKIKKVSEIFSQQLEYHLYHFNEGAYTDFNAKAEGWTKEVAGYIESDQVFFRHDTRTGRLDADDDMVFNISYFCKNSDIDVLMLIHNKRSFFQNFFRRSLVKNVIHKVEFPMLFYKQ